MLLATKRKWALTKVNMAAAWELLVKNIKNE